MLFNKQYYLHFKTPNLHPIYKLEVENENNMKMKIIFMITVIKPSKLDLDNFKFLEDTYIKDYIIMEPLSFL